MRIISWFIRLANVRLMLVLPHDTTSAMEEYAAILIVIESKAKMLLENGIIICKLGTKFASHCDKCVTIYDKYLTCVCSGS